MKEKIIGTFGKYKVKFVSFIESVSNLKNLNEIEHPNIAFYKNEIPFYPSGFTIENILKTKNEDYRFLEETHTYIQWLFPNRDPGLNSCAYILTDYEIKVISETPKLRERVRRAFEMMLGLYGMRITKGNQFCLAENAPQRLHILNRPFNHNYLRITRILLAIKELGHHKLILPWMMLLAGLIYKDNLLNFAASSFENYWLKTLDAEEEMKLKSYVDELKSIKHSVVTKSMNPSTISTTTYTINGNSINDNMSTTGPFNFNSTTTTLYHKPVSQKNDNQDYTPSKIASDIHYVNHEYQHLSRYSMPLQSPTHVPHDKKMKNVDYTPSGTTPEKVTRSNSLKNLSSQ